MRKSRLSKVKQYKLIEHFVAGTTARCAADLIGVNRKTAAYYYHRLREIISNQLEQEVGEFVSGEIEVDESYFGGHRKGKRGRGAAGKVPVFGLLKRGGKVYTKIIPNARADTLMPIIQEKVIPDSIVYTDCWRGYNVLDVSEFKHYRINHSKLFANKHNHINGIENFWNQAKRHMRKFNGVPKEHFHLFLKECEWRFNNPNPKSQLIQLKQWVKIPVLFTFKNMDIEPFCELKPDWVDLELEEFDHLFPLVKSAKVIVSKHRVSLEELAQVIAQLQTKDADLFKCVLDEVTPLQALQFVHEKKDPRLILLSVGIGGQLTRILSSKMHNPIHYVSIESFPKTAPGQLTIDELNHYHLSDQKNLFGLIGNPVGGSKGHLFHNHIYKILGMDACYVKIQLEEKNLP